MTRQEFAGSNEGAVALQTRLMKRLAIKIVDERQGDRGASRPELVKSRFHYSSSFSTVRRADPCDGEGVGGRATALERGWMCGYSR